MRASAAANARRRAVGAGARVSGATTADCDCAPARRHGRAGDAPAPAALACAGEQSCSSAGAVAGCLTRVGACVCDDGNCLACHCRSDGFGSIRCCGTNIVCPAGGDSLPRHCHARLAAADPPAAETGLVGVAGGCAVGVWRQHHGGAGAAHGTGRQPMGRWAVQLECLSAGEKRATERNAKALWLQARVPPPCIATAAVNTHTHAHALTRASHARSKLFARRPRPAPRHSHTQVRASASPCHQKRQEPRLLLTLLMKRCVRASLARARSSSSRRASSRAARLL